MKKFFIILFLLPLLVGCSEEDTLLSERDKIEKYLTSSRGMIAEEALGSVIEEEPAFYSTFGRYAYRHIVNYYDADRELKPTLDWGDRAEIRFNAYVFSGNEPTVTSGLYLSNVQEVIDEAGKKSGNTLAWSNEPLVVELGTTKLLRGVEMVLAGCHEADSVQVYMTSGLAYGTGEFGIVPKNSMVAWYMKIEKVTK